MNPRTRMFAVAGAIALTVTFASSAAAETAMPKASADRTMPHIEIGVPGEDIGDKQDAGLVEVRYSGGTTKSLVAPDPEAGARFGTATAAYDIDRDNRQDLFVGAPGADVDGKAGAGAVYVYRGTPNGLTYWKTLTMDSLDTDDAELEAQAGAGFGASMARDWIQGDTEYNNRIAVGAPEYDVGPAENAGAVVEIEVAQGDRPTFNGGLWTGADWPDGTSEAGDRFGASIFEYDTFRIIGAPGKTVNGQPGAGAIFAHAISTTGFLHVLTQDSPGVPGAAEPGDHFGAAVLIPWEVYIGAPGEDVGTRENAGLVQRIDKWNNEGPVPGPAFTQNSVDDVTGKPLAGSAEAGDRFGSALAWYAEDWHDWEHIYVGVPGEDTGEKSNAGMVNVLYNAETPGLTNRSLGGRNQAGNRFGAALYARVYDFPTAAIGVPGKNAGSGIVQLVEPERATWYQITGAREPGDNYGASIGSSL